MIVDKIQLEIWLGMMKSEMAGSWQIINCPPHVIPVGILENIQEICELALKGLEK